MLKRVYGISAEEYDELEKQQDKKCKICGCENSYKTKDGNSRRLVVDHNHLTGVIRGLLCDRCNLILGKADDDSGLLTKMISYLDDPHSGPPVQIVRREIETKESSI